MKKVLGNIEATCKYVSEQADIIKSRNKMNEYKELKKVIEISIFDYDLLTCEYAEENIDDIYFTQIEIVDKVKIKKDIFQ